MKYIFRCEDEDGKPAYVAVTDLDAFVKAGPDEDVFVADADGNQSRAKKGGLRFLSVDHD